jgi:hypothetical protein
MDQPARPRRRADPGVRPGEQVRPSRWPALQPEVCDRTGRSLAKGDAVRIGEGEYRGQLAEVVGWGGRRGVELLIQGRPPVFVAVPPEQLELVSDVVLVDPVTPRSRPRSG